MNRFSQLPIVLLSCFGWRPVALVVCICSYVSLGIHGYFFLSFSLSLSLSPLALLSCSGHLCKGKQRTEGWKESGSGGGGRKSRRGKWLGEREDQWRMKEGLLTC